MTQKPPFTSTSANMWACWVCTPFRSRVRFPLEWINKGRLSWKEAFNNRISCISPHEDELVIAQFELVIFGEDQTYSLMIIMRIHGPLEPTRIFRGGGDQGPTWAGFNESNSAGAKCFKLFHKNQRKTVIFKQFLNYWENFTFLQSLKVLLNFSRKFGEK